MCDYCEEKTKDYLFVIQKFNCNIYLVVNPDNKNMFDKPDPSIDHIISIRGGDKEITHMTINYCPMCGRKLRKVDNARY